MLNCKISYNRKIIAIHTCETEMPLQNQIGPIVLFLLPLHRLANFDQSSMSTCLSFILISQYIFFSFYSIYICGGYNLIVSVKECYKLNLSNTTQGWVPIAPLIKGRFNFKMVAANGFIYAVGGEGPFSEHDDIEVHCKYKLKLTQTNKQNI